MTLTFAQAYGTPINSTVMKMALEMRAIPIERGWGLDYGQDGQCAYEEDARDNRDGAVDEAGECASGCTAGSDIADNDEDGRIDEQRRGELEAGPVDERYRGPDLDGSQDNCPIANENQADLTRMVWRCLR